MNIISNAVKYNKEKGVILLSYYETQVDDRHILFEFHCKDTGVGMSKEFQNHIFEPFTQETGGARSVYGGTGLGMPITKKLIEKMGGTIKFESEKNVGTTFMVQLPFLISADMKQAESQEDDVSIEGMKILLAEDNELNMEIATSTPVELHITVPCSRTFRILLLLGARSWEARRDIPVRRACAWPALRKFMTGNIFW